MLDNQPLKTEALDKSNIGSDMFTKDQISEVFAILDRV